MTDFLSLTTPGIRGLQPYQPGKPIDELAREYGLSDIIKLASNENPLGPSPKAIAAMRAALEQIWLYPDGNGFELKQRIAALHAVELSQITLGNGSSDPLDFAVRCFAGPGDEVLFSEHAFALYPLLTRSVGATPVAVAAKAWGHDLEAIADRVSANTRLIFIANPNNPTGTWLGAESLERFVAGLPAEVIVVIDEAYVDYARYPATGASDYPDTIGWLARYPNLIITRTFSKSYGLAGARVGYALSHPQVAGVLNRVRPPFNVNTLALVAAVAALDDPAHLRRSLAMNAEGLQQLYRGFDGLGLDYIPSVGNFVSVDVGRPGEEVYQALLQRGIIVRPVANYGMPNHLRVTVGLPEENRRLLEALAAILDEDVVRP